LYGLIRLAWINSQRRTAATLQAAIQRFPISNSLSP
jgi:hypothetical protein